MIPSPHKGGGAGWDSLLQQTCHMCRQPAGRSRMTRSVMSCDDFSLPLCRRMCIRRTTDEAQHRPLGNLFLSVPPKTRDFQSGIDRASTPSNVLIFANWTKGICLGSTVNPTHGIHREPNTRDLPVHGWDHANGKGCTLAMSQVGFSRGKFGPPAGRRVDVEAFQCRIRRNQAREPDFRRFFVPLNQGFPAGSLSFPVTGWSVSLYRNDVWSLSTVHGSFLVH